MDKIVTFIKMRIKKMQKINDSLKLKKNLSSISGDFICNKEEIEKLKIILLRIERNEINFKKKFSIFTSDFDSLMEKLQKNVLDCEKMESILDDYDVKMYAKTNIYLSIADYMGIDKLEEICKEI
ncbi:hypothetical protein EDEG_00943 [Edhazardia aedis USNM 41457]|uniref:Uncharacterized protein n=1 Tax=Edhazardia aedis (strain USNM 41457) TaxID=1003232 RepID=J8ZYW6_EDHAE|nr:hypothetical protein EDEG_00943 [Edhazardia aedis USNM 41457]|eukprot:EJW04873.1 hypothetical protein EDEG_00943 [Edhazardia aedis USNM 41457]